MVVSYNDKEKGGRLGVLHLDKYDSMSYIKGDWTSYSDICLVGDNIYFIGSSPTKAACVVQYNLVDHATTILKLSAEIDLPLEDISVPRTIEFPTENGLTAFGIFYEPKNSQYEGLENEKPPLLVKIHGGPTAACGSEFKKGIQYWTTRGFAVLDVNYGGSTGYGREYRQRLNGNWGVVDVDDCCNGARYLVKHGWVDGKRLAIDGGSAGGYTTLACLAFRSVFSAGASHYGVSDLEALAQETHKFEARYLDTLIGEYPKSKDLYVKRSPIHHIEGFDAPLALFQGDEDVVVPPNQSEMIYEKVKAKGLPVSYTLFKGEQHGFRKAENIRRAVDGEFYFFSKVFGFPTAENLDNIIEIDNLKK
jgi:dipeptidyl aminopeptidase/acylaminoacyl peptidase